MRPWSRQHTLGLGIAIIVVTNAVALAGVWWNRQPPADSNPALSERELSLPWRGPRLRENSGLALDLRWRVIDREGAEFGSGFPFNSGTPQWLDAGRMAALGFAPAGAAANAQARWDLAAPSRFSPNGDGVQDELRLRLTVSERTHLRLTIGPASERTVDRRVRELDGARRGP